MTYLEPPEATSPAGRSIPATIAGLLRASGVTTVFGEPISHGGVTVVPVARISGGGGGGGAAPHGPAEPEGSGGGVGFTIRPVGAYVIRDGTVHWRPALDINKIILGGQVVAITALLTARALLRRRRRPSR